MSRPSTSFLFPCRKDVDARDKPGMTKAAGLFAPRGLGQLPLQRARFLKAPGDVANDRHRPGRLALRVFQHRDRELDRDALAASGQRGYRQEIAMAVMAVSGLHDAPISDPVPVPKMVGNDEIERTPDGFIDGEAENPDGPGIPESDVAGVIGGND